MARMESWRHGGNDFMPETALSQAQITRNAERWCCLGGPSEAPRVRTLELRQQHKAIGSCACGDCAVVEKRLRATPPCVARADEQDPHRHGSRRTRTRLFYFAPREQ